MKYWKLLIENWLIVAVIVLATFLRTSQLDTHAILFGDAAHDLMQAAQSVRTGQVPLLGIASSVPRFKQGPLTVWLEMFVYLIAGHRMLVYSLVFALISLAAVIAIYEFATIHVSKKVGLLSALLVATSPLAVAHGRVVYHITPIPLMMVVYWFSLVRLWQKQSMGIFWAVLAWAGLFQFELALLPAFFIIPYILWRTKQRFERSWIAQGGAAIVIGLLPQLIYDFQHGFKQLGGFAVWVGYRIVSATGLVGEHTLSPSRFGQTLSLLWLYGGRIVSTDVTLVKLLMLGLLLVAVGLIFKTWRKKKLPPAVEIVAMVSLLLLGGFVIHSAPSEAYFPPFIVCLPLIVAYGTTLVRKPFQLGIIGLLVAGALFNTVQIVRHSFFVSNSQAFSYGPSVMEQREAIRLMKQASDGPYQLATTNEGGKYPSYFDNFRWLAQEQGTTERNNGRLFYIESKDSELVTYPGMKRVMLPSIDIYQLPSL